MYPFMCLRCMEHKIKPVDLSALLKLHSYTGDGNHPQAMSHNYYIARVTEKGAVLKKIEM